MSATPGSRTIRTDSLARVEGEGAMLVRIAGGQVQEVKLRIYEPPRFFEALLRGRAFTEAPDITSRICGIGPIAYQMSAVRARESACGIAILAQLEMRAADAQPEYHGLQKTTPYAEVEFAGDFRTGGVIRAARSNVIGATTRQGAVSAAFPAGPPTEPRSSNELRSRARSIPA